MWRCLWVTAYCPCSCCKPAGIMILPHTEKEWGGTKPRDLCLAVTALLRANVTPLSKTHSRWAGGFLETMHWKQLCSKHSAGRGLLCKSLHVSTLHFRLCCLYPSVFSTKRRGWNITGFALKFSAFYNLFCKSAGSTTGSKFSYNTVCYSQDGNYNRTPKTSWKTSGSSKPALGQWILGTTAPWDTSLNFRHSWSASETLWVAPAHLSSWLTSCCCFRKASKPPSRA